MGEMSYMYLYVHAHPLFLWITSVICFNDHFSLPPSLSLSLSVSLPLPLFHSQEDGFKLYTTYCTNYNSSMLCLQQLLMSEKHNQFLDQCQRNLKHSLPLSAQLIKPVQRIMRYHLLLHVSHMIVM